MSHPHLPQNTSEFLAEIYEILKRQEAVLSQLRIDVEGLKAEAFAAHSHNFHVAVANIRDAMSEVTQRRADLYDSRIAALRGE